MANTPPSAILWSYYTKQPGAGLPGAPSVFDALADAPATGTAGETVTKNRAKAVGVNKGANTAPLLDATRQRDHLRDFYDSTSILH